MIELLTDCHRSPVRDRIGRASKAATRAMVVGVALMAGADAALAQALDIDAPEIKAGEREIRSINILNRGYRPVSAGEPRSSHEIDLGYSPVDWFKGIVHLDIENLIGDGAIADHIGLESFVALRKAGDEGGLALTWYTGVMISTDELSTSSLVFGPILKLSRGKGSVTLNSYFDHTFGRNSGPGVNLAYALQAKYELSERVAIGVEGFGRIENLGSAPVWDEQDHRIGPGVFLSWDGEGGRGYGLDIGVLSGLTDAAPDVTLKVTFGTTF